MTDLDKLAKIIVARTPWPPTLEAYKALAMLDTVADELLAVVLTADVFDRCIIEDRGEAEQALNNALVVLKAKLKDLP